jgi:hypothetical protein
MEQQAKWVLAVLLALQALAGLLVPPVVVLQVLLEVRVPQVQPVHKVQQALMVV